MMKLWASFGVVLLVLMFCVVRATHAQPAMPFEEKDCGTIGNVLAIAGHVRDEGKSEEFFKKEAEDALKECQQVNGVDGCSVRNEQQKKFMDAAFDFLWQNPKIDGTEFATEFYNLCTKQAAKPM